ncbi:MAG: transglycosylase SLT domain-containing protein [Candidatus Sericytochromatia bacterium]|nr:transglycosylase SLT domain-containing protein [Candidatus Sericytochromatia bacterium]
MRPLLTVALLALLASLTQPVAADPLLDQTLQRSTASATDTARTLDWLKANPEHFLRPAWLQQLAQAGLPAEALQAVLSTRDPLWPHFYWWRAMAQDAARCSGDFAAYARQAQLSSQGVMIADSTALQERLHCVEALSEPARLTIARQVQAHRYFWLMPRLLGDVQAPEGLMLLLEAQMTGRQYQAALATAQRLLKQTAAPGDLKKQAVIQAGRAARFLRQPATALQWWDWIQPADARFYPEVLWERAELAQAQDQTGLSEQLLTRLLQQYAQHERVPDALELLLRQKLQAQHWPAVESLSQQVLRDWPDHELAAQARYWLAHSLQQRGQSTAARQHWQAQVAQGAVNNYYTQLSRCQLAERDCFQLPSEGLPPLQSRAPQMNFLAPYPELKSLLTPERAPLALAVAPFLSPLAETDRLLLTSYALRLNGNYFRAIRTIWQLPARDQDMLRLMYPLHYDALQKENAARYRIPQALIAGLTWQESMYKADIRSPSGALGLMQLMPATASYIAPKAGLNGFQLSQLTDPKINIRLGSYYLYEQLQRWRGNLLPMIASYNAGPNAVARWMQARGNLDKALFVEQIPYAETRRYVKQVLTHMYVYQTIYAD